MSSAKRGRSNGVTLADEEEHVLRCLGAALIMQWNALPTKLQRELFDNAGSMGELMETAALRGQIARFLHRYKNDDNSTAAGSEQKLLTAMRCLNADSMARWDDEGGACQMPEQRGMGEASEEDSSMPLTGLAVDEGPHSMDGLLLHGWEGPERVEAFISRRVMDSWVDPREPYRGRRACFGHNTTPSASSISRRLSELPPPSTSAGLRSPASIRSWIFCCPTSGKAKRRSIRANWCASRRLPLSIGFHVRIVAIRFARAAVVLFAEAGGPNESRAPA